MSKSYARTLKEERGQDLWKQEKSPEGRPLCRFCKSSVPKPKRTFCSDKCIEEWRIRNSPSYARQAVFDRDHGVCKDCGRDTEAIRNQINSVWERWVAFREQAWLAWNDSWTQEERNAVGWNDLELRLHGSLAWLSWLDLLADLKQQNFSEYHILNRQLWQIDHVLEVINGGGTCGLDNLETRCCPCHRLKTSKLAAARAAQRRQSTLRRSTEPKDAKTDDK